MNVPAQLIEALRQAQHVVVLTGSGVSAESGVPTFRDAQTGLWSRFRPEDLATPQAFQRDPKTVWEWYEWRRSLVTEVEPNPGHAAIARLEQQVPQLTLITQNVDGLHQRAGSASALEFHGNILGNRCFDEHRVLGDDELTPGTPPTCNHCGGYVRPDVVWFGEEIDQGVLDTALTACARCDVLLSVGTASEVQPAAGLAELALSCDAVVAEINPADTPLSSQVHFCLRGPAGELLPQLVAAIEEE